MNYRTAGIVAGVAIILCACTPHYSKLNWEPIVAGAPPIEMALARCQMMSSSVNQGYFAMGTPEFVMGAGIGNAIANDMRQNDFVVQCMMMSGWRGVAASSKQRPRHVQTHSPLTGKPMKGKGEFPAAPS